jgi:hypothetical protein
MRPQTTNLGVRTSNLLELSTILDSLFCRPFCKICFNIVLKLFDGPIGKLAGASQIFFEHLLMPRRRKGVNAVLIIAA